MLTYFPKYFTTRAIVVYLLTLFIVSMFFMGNAMAIPFMLFGFFAVVVFFAVSAKLTESWQIKDPEVFAKRLFLVALIIRLAYVVFIYYYYKAKTGIPHAFDAKDELFYNYIGTLWSKEGFLAFQYEVTAFADFSDRGYCYWLAIEHLIFGTEALPPRIIKCIFDAATCA